MTQAKIRFFFSRISPNYQLTQGYDTAIKFYLIPYPIPLKNGIQVEGRQTPAQVGVCLSPELNNN
jgi:hypothetical protein